MDADNYRLQYPDQVEAMARRLFEVDDKLFRARVRFGSFDDMPPGMQDWWRDRAARLMLSDETSNAQGTDHP